MKRTLALAAALALAACADASQSPTAVADDAPRAGKYIVVYKDASFSGPRLSVASAIAEVAEAEQASPRFVYAGVVKGFAAELSGEQVARLRADPRVAYVEEDAPARLFTTQFFPTWGIDRIDQADLPLSSSFTYTATGAGVRAYVLDTGVRITHAQFEGRASYLPNATNGNFVGDGQVNAADCHGHGTHVAGTVAGRGYGVAKKALIVAARVTNCVGGGDASMAIAAMDWIRLNGTKPAVVNMSLGYGNLQSVRDAAANLVTAGYVVVAAAGNGNFAGTPENACLQSPAGAPSILTVGATNSSDQEWASSNYGTCIDVLAPGVSINSALHTSDTASGLKSGTSMASPHVAGVAAQFLSANPGSPPWWVGLWIVNNATTNTITLNASSTTGGTPNRFVFTNW
jgi:subtilisin family serine protease